MLTISYRNHLFNFIERIGTGEVKDLMKVKTDVLLSMDLSLTVPKAPVLLNSKHKQAFELNIPNFLINVTEDEDALFKKISKSIRAEIRKAEEQHHFTYVEYDPPTDSQLMEFSFLYDSFAKARKISHCNLEKLRALRDNNALVMTQVVDEQHNILCSGMLIKDKVNRQLYGLYGVSVQVPKEAANKRRIIGRANKYLHWKEIQSAKNRGMKWYNFGGEVHQGEGEGVNNFKKRFGTIQGYDRRVYIPRSLLGKICVYLLYIKWKRVYNSVSYGGDTYHNRLKKVRS